MSDVNRYALIAIGVIVVLGIIWYMYGGGGTPTVSTTPTQPPAQQQQTPAGTTK